MFRILLISFLITSCAGQEQQKNISSKSNQEKIDSITQADELFNLAEYASAAEKYKEAASNKKKPSEELNFKLAESLRLSANCKEAEPIYLNHSTNDSFNEGLALCYLQEGDLKKSSKILAKIVQNDASKWRAINALGVVYSLAGHKEEAKQYFNIALEVNNKNPVILNNIALSMAFSDQAEESLKIAQNALDKTTNPLLKTRIINNIALIYGLMGKEEEAKKMLAGTPLSEAQIYNNLGIYAKIRNDNNIAKSYLNKALSSSPVHYEKAWNNLQSID